MKKHYIIWTLYLMILVYAGKAYTQVGPISNNVIIGMGDVNIQASPNSTVMIPVHVDLTGITAVDNSQTTVPLVLANYRFIIQYDSNLLVPQLTNGTVTGGLTPEFSDVVNANVVDNGDNQEMLIIYASQPSQVSPVNNIHVADIQFFVKDQTAGANTSLSITVMDLRTPVDIVTGETASIMGGVSIPYIANPLDINIAFDTVIVDTDADGMDDTWEIMVFGNIIASDGTADVNANGINDLLEYNNSLFVPEVATGDVNFDGIVDIRDLLMLQRHMLSIQLLSPDEIARADLYPLNGDSLITISDLLAIQNIILNTPSSVVDTDGDLLPDDWEIENGLNPNDASDAIIDSDIDGLTNAQERYYGTYVHESDTDSDGFSDGDEVAAGTNPVDATHYSVKITSIPITLSQPGSLYNYVLQANQPNVIYELETSPSGVSIINNGGVQSIRWVTTIADLGVHTVSVRASVHGVPSDLQTYTLTINGVTGDLSGDGILDITDVLLAQRQLLGEALLTAEQLALGDLYPADAPDGEITISDILLLQQLMLGDH